MAEKVRLFYTIIQDLIMFISLLFGIIYWKPIKQSYLKLFPVYTFGSLLVPLTWHVKKLNFLGIGFQNFFIVIELAVFLNFFFQIPKLKRYHTMLFILSLSFFIAVMIIPAVLYNIQNKYSTLALFFQKRVQSELIVIENILIVIPILFYYRSLFNPPFTSNLSTNPVFLVMTGMLFCFATSVPIFLFQKSIMLQNRDIYIYLYIINAFSYILMHLFFIRAYINLKNARIDYHES